MGISKTTTLNGKTVLVKDCNKKTFKPKCICKCCEHNTPTYIYESGGSSVSMQPRGNTQRGGSRSQSYSSDDSYSYS